MGFDHNPPTSKRDGWTDIFIAIPRTPRTYRMCGLLQ